MAEIEAVYKRAGYEVYAISAQQGINVGKLKDRLYGKITVFAGPSGVGKSSTLNAIEPGMQLVTGSVSEKIGRGKHTTRFAHLLPFAGGYLADTPGFGNLNLEELDDKKLRLHVPANLQALKMDVNLRPAHIRTNRYAASKMRWQPER